MRYGTTSDLPPNEVLAQARRFFSGKWGLTERQHDAGSVTFEGAGGGVTVAAAEAGDHTDIELLAREWDRQAREFLKEVDHG